MRLLSLQMLPWCFHMLHQQQHQEDVDAGGIVNPSGSGSVEVPKCSIRSVRVVGPDGRVQVYERAVAASELMREFPRHLVCHSESFLIGQKVPALSAEEQLQLGQSYFLLPASFFHSVLSFVTVASSLVFIATKPADHKNKMKTRPPPFDIRKTEKGMLQIRISEEVLMGMMIKNDEAAAAAAAAHSFWRVCSSEELEKEYRQLVVVGRRREWKSRLDTITEEEHSSHSQREEKISRRNWSLLGRRKRKKKQLKIKRELIHSAP